MNFKQLAQTIATAATLLIAQPIQAETLYFHNDHLGTPQALTNDSGTMVWQGSYSPFGEVNETTDTVEQNIRFPGQYFEEETGLHYNYFRDYDPGTGRYIESDPIGLQGGVNTFGYVSGNPLLSSDPRGLAETGAAAGAGIGCGVFGFFGSAAGGAAGGVAGLACGPGAPACSSAAGTAGAAAGGTAGCTGGAIVGSIIGSAIEDIINDDVDESDEDGSCPAAAASSSGDGPENSDQCKKWIAKARGRYLKLTSERIPQYLTGGSGGSDVGHYNSILQSQAGLKTAIKRVKNSCKTLPFDLIEWERAANRHIPILH